MELGPLRSLALGLAFDTHGVSCNVTAPNCAPVPTTGIWLRPEPQDQPYGKDIGTREPLRIMALRRDVVPECPNGTVITAPERKGGPQRIWEVSGVEITEGTHWRCEIVPKTLKSPR